MSTQRFVSIRHFARYLSRHPNWALMAAIIFTVLSIYKMQDLQVEMDVADLLPKDLEVVQITQAALQDFGSFDFMLVVLESSEGNQEELLKKAADELAYALDYRQYIRRVTHKLDPESLNLDSPQGKALAVSLLTDEDWDILENQLKTESIELAAKRLVALLNVAPYSRYKDLAKDPLNISKIITERTEIKTGPLKVNLKDNYFISDDGEMLLMLVWPVKPSTDLRFAQDFQKFLEETKAGIYKRNPEFIGNSPEEPNIRISFFGSHYEAITDQELVQKDLYLTTIYSFLAVLILFFFAFRRPEALLFVLIPLVIGVTWTVGIATLVVGRLTQVTISFAAILVGLGIDFSIHLYNRFLEENETGCTARESIRLAIVEIGPSLIAGATTTALAFSGLMITRFVGFQELGFIVAIGVVCCLISVLLILPPMLNIFGSGKLSRYTYRPLPSFGLEQFHFTVLAYPRLALVTSMVVTVFIGLFAPQVGFEDDFAMLKKTSDEYLELQNRLEQHFRVPANQIVLVVQGQNDPQVALEENDKLFENLRDLNSLNPDAPLVVDSLRHFIPSAQSQRIQLQRMANFPTDQLRITLERIARENNLSIRIFEEFLTTIDEFKSSAQKALEDPNVPIDITRLDRSANPALIDIAQRYTYKTRDGNWRILTQVYPPLTEEWRDGVPNVFMERISSRLQNGVEITGPVIIQQQVRELMIRDLAISVLVVFFAITLVLCYYFSSLFKALLSLLPVIMGLLTTLGVMSMVDMKLHYINIIALPLIVGIGVDSGIYMIQRFYENPDHDLKTTVIGTGRAVLISSLTTIFGFGALAFAEYEGIRDLGLVSIIGVGSSLIFSLIVLPTLLRLREENLLEQEPEGDELG